MKWRSLLAEALGTALLVFFAVGTATLTFGFKVTGASESAGVVMTALAFGLVLLVLVYAIGPISGCHINPAVTIGFLVSRRITLSDAAGYWAAQVVGCLLYTSLRASRPGRPVLPHRASRTPCGGAGVQTTCSLARLPPSARTSSRRQQGSVRILWTRLQPCCSVKVSAPR